MNDEELIVKAIELASAGKRVLVLTKHYHDTWILSDILRDMVGILAPHVPRYTREHSMRLGEGRIDFVEIDREERLYGLQPNACLIHYKIADHEVPKHVKIQLPIWNTL